MRKIAFLAVTVLMLSLAAVAYAQTQTNTYTVTGSTSPTNAGTSSSPRNLSVKFGYTVGEQAGLRPSPVKKYSIRFAGLRVNTAAFPKCSASTLDSRGERGCPAGSKVGSGFIKNATGATSNKADRSIACNAALSVYNAGANKAVIYVNGSPNSSNPNTRCAIELAAPIPARFIRSAGATALEFTVPPSLLHPLPTLDNAVTSVTSTISGRTRTYRGKKVSFFQSIGGCVNNKRNITVTFTPESGTASRAQRLAPCRK
jgi:hypothetical protein